MQVNKTFENPCQSAMDEYTNKWITKKKKQRSTNGETLFSMCFCIVTYKRESFRITPNHTNPSRTFSWCISMVLTLFLPIYIDRCKALSCVWVSGPTRFHTPTISTVWRRQSASARNRAPDRSNIFLICFMIFPRLYLNSKEIITLFIYDLTK